MDPSTMSYPVPSPETGGSAKREYPTQAIATPATTTRTDNPISHRRRRCGLLSVGYRPAGGAGLPEGEGSGPTVMHQM
ncbi:hypothetical protein GCM10009773_25130 [Williamsia serinedens]